MLIDLSTIRRMSDLIATTDDRDEEAGFLDTLEGETDEPSIGAKCVQCTSSACGAASGLIYPLMDDVTDLLRERWNKRHNARHKPTREAGSA